MLVDVARVWAPGRSLSGRHTSEALTRTNHAGQNRQTMPELIVIWITCPYEKVA